MPTPDEEFVKKLQATFKVEAEEHLQALSTMLLELEKSTSSAHAAPIIENVYREAHSLKGAARAVDLSDIEGICQALESVFSTWKRQQISPSPEVFDTLHGAVDKVGTLLASPKTRQKDGQDRQYDELIHLLNQLQSGVSSLQVSAPIPPAVEIPPAQPAEPDKSAAETVRISIAKLDARLLQAEDMLTVKGSLAERARELRDLTSRFEQWRRECGKISAEARALGQSAENGNAKILNFLEANSDSLQSLSNGLSSVATRAEQDRHNVGKRVDELLEESKKLLMLPFSTLAGLFPKMVRDLCRDQEKDADLVIKGGEIEIDKRILEEMKDPFIHILRNCIDHGVEKKEQRSRLKKPDRATLTVAVTPVNGNKVEILVSDDGAGIDVDSVKKSAVSHGIVSETEARQLNDNDVLPLIFHSEVTTSPIVTAISGRGLGMAIVRAKIESLGGRITIESKRQAGTTLRMVLPLTLATLRGILVSVSDRTFIIQTTNIERVLRIKPQEIQTVENRETILLQGRAVSLARMSAVLELPVKPDRRDVDAPLPVVVLNSAGQRIAFAVDEVLREEEVLFKPLLKPLVRVRNIAGATVLGSGKVAPILNVSDLMKSARKCGAAPVRTADPTVGTPLSKTKILVVEDSVTSRMLLKGILESAGYEVKTAVDGVEGYTTLREGEFDLLVSDVEMPRMNGFDLATKVRADKQLSELPVILVTALESREERERGIDAGANAYIVKSSFNQSNLLEVVQQLV